MNLANGKFEIFKNIYFLLNFSILLEKRYNYKMTNIIYIHGFRSGGRGGKYDRLKRRFRREFYILSPSFSDRVLSARKGLHSLMRENSIAPGKKTVVIGTSLGGFYSYYLSVLYDLRSVLINPVLNPSEHMKKYINKKQKNFRSGREFMFTQKDIDELKSMETEIEKKISQGIKMKTFVVIGKKDNVINKEIVEEKFKNILYMDEGHEFNERFDELISMKGFRDFVTL